MIEQIERFPRVRDRALFVGDPERSCGTFGPDCPKSQVDQAALQLSRLRDRLRPSGVFADRAALRAELGYRLGGADLHRLPSVVPAWGRSLLKRVILAFPEAKDRQLPALRMLVVAGPRIDPASLVGAPRAGLELRPYVDQLYRHLAACDLAVVQGGLTTTMELLPQIGRPFLYFPLRHHFEQNFHVRHRLHPVRGGSLHGLRELRGPSEGIAAAIVEEIGREVDYRPVETDGAARAAGLIAELL